MRVVVEAEDLVKDFGEVRALDGLSFHVKSGENYGFIGPNGAGKTTALRIIATLLKPTSGKVRVLGRDVVDEASEIRKLISYLPEEAGAYKNLLVGKLTGSIIVAIVGAVAYIIGFSYYMTPLHGSHSGRSRCGSRCDRFNADTCILYTSGCFTLRVAAFSLSVSGFLIRLR